MAEDASCCVSKRVPELPQLAWGQPPSAARSRKARRFRSSSQCGFPVEILWAQSVDMPAAGPVTLSGFKREFDPGSESTLAACLTHASRTRKRGQLRE